MLDDGVIYEGRKVTGRSKHRRPRRAESVEVHVVEVGKSPTSSTSSSSKIVMRRDVLEPELAHPGEERGMSSHNARAATLRSAGKQAFLSVVKETVELMALEAASTALQEETDRMDAMQQTARRERANGGKSHRRRGSMESSGSSLGFDIPPPASRPMTGVDSASGSTFDSHSPRMPLGRKIGSNGSIPPPAERQRHSQSKSVSNGHGNGLGLVAATVAGFEGERGGSREVGRVEAVPFKDTANDMEDEERETLLSLLSGAYTQVNELTDELQISLEKLHETEVELRTVKRSESNSQLLPKNDGGTASDDEGVEAEEAAMEREARRVHPTAKVVGGKNKPVSKFLKGFFPSDEGARSTPANVRQLQVEVQRLRQRVQQANSKEEKHRADLARSQRLMAVMESQLNDPSPPSPTPPRRSSVANGSSRGVSAGRSDVRAPSNGPFCMTPGGTRYQDGVTRPLVDRVAELEEKLVNCSMENATAKQDYLTVKLRNSQLEKNTQRLRHELAKSRAMNDLLQNEIDRLQGTMSPEGEADGKGWRRWLGGLQEPLSPEPNPIRVTGDSDSPVVVVRDLDNNQLVYAPGRADFM